LRRAAFCRSLVVSDRQSEDPMIYHLADPALYPKEIIAQQEWLSFRNVGAERIRFDDYVSDKNTQSMLRRFMDFGNDGRNDSVIEIYESTFYFYGNLFIILDIDKHKTAIQTLLDRNKDIVTAVESFRLYDLRRHSDRGNDLSADRGGIRQPLF
jgi:hypothetical protein